MGIALDPTTGTLVHTSAMNLMRGFIAGNLDQRKHYDVLDFGSFINTGQTLNHRQLLQEYDVTYIGVDIQPGRNVDIQMTQPYKIPLSNSQDVVLSGQVFEHIPFPWASILEIARVLRTGGRVHDDGAVARPPPLDIRLLALLPRQHARPGRPGRPEAGAHGGPTGRRPSCSHPQRHDFHQIDMANHYWGDTGAVFRKPKWRLSPRRGVNRYFTLQRANRIGDLSTHPRPKGTRLNAPTVQAPSEEA